MRIGIKPGSSHGPHQEKEVYFGIRKWEEAIENQEEGSVYLVNLNSGTGRVLINGKELKDLDSIKSRLKTARALLIEDVYGLVLPFMLKDSGVTLKYVGEDTLKGNQYNVLQLSFPKIDNNSQREYKIYVDIKEKLVKYWSYYADSRQQTPTFTRP